MALSPTSSRGSGGGGGLTTWGQSNQATYVGAGSPVGVITPNGAGDLYVDNTTPGLYQANGVLNTSWQLIGLESGTSFPGSPADGNWFYRTDRNVLYFWKASVSRWLTVDLKYAQLGATGAINGTFAATNNFGYLPLFEDVYVEKFNVATFVQTTNNGTNFWSLQGNKYTAANVATAIASFDTSADTVATWTQHSVAVNALILASGFAVLQGLVSAKTGTPGGMFVASMLTLRAAG